ncbi:FecCD family ABC transporter permease [Geminicoccus harenae]|uniref:FecCD family ABC transporter permease n=1 Tax=Geminicoccus harenae TaxID=2498453 RepID=UPI00168AF9FA|nr:iron ABC transporter permease [Geminicoccus harenae]
MSDRALGAGLVLLLALLFSGSLLLGPATPALAFLQGLLADPDGPLRLILVEIRLPRALLGAMTGASLGLAGAALQGYLRNPLAEPGIVGVSASAAFGAVLAFYSGLATLLPLAMPVSGILGAMLGVLLVQALAGTATLGLILAGVAVSSFASALTSLALNLSPNPFAATEITFWLMGSLADRSFDHVWLALPFTVTGWLCLLTTGRALDALSLDEDAAASLGFDLARLRLVLLAGVALAVGAATAVTGVVGFVGLVVPHLLRPLVGHRPARLLPLSALGGACLMLASDLLVRLVTPGQELKLGVVTALIGTPFFFFLVLRAARTAP